MHRMDLYTGYHYGSGVSGLRADLLRIGLYAQTRRVSNVTVDRIFWKTTHELYQILQHVAVQHASIIKDTEDI